MTATQETQDSTAGERAGAVLVTGAASGLGAAVVDLVTQGGGVAVGIDREECTGIDHEKVDVSDRHAVEAAVDALAERAGGLRAVVTAAGIDRCGLLSDVAADEWERVIGVNLLGTVSTVRAALPHLERSRGTVVTVASTLGIKAVSEATAYCASKFGVVGFTRALAAETAGRVGVTLLIPGGMSTHFFDDRDPRFKPGPDANLSAPHDVARAILGVLSHPPGVEVRELVVAPSLETSWP